MQRPSPILRPRFGAHREPIFVRLPETWATHCQQGGTCGNYVEATWDPLALTGGTMPTRGRRPCGEPCLHDFGSSTHGGLSHPGGNRGRDPGAILRSTNYRIGHERCCGGIEPPRPSGGFGEEQGGARRTRDCFHSVLSFVMLL